MSIRAWIGERLPGLARHWRVLRAAWAHENETAPNRRAVEETAFLPAALEVMETPPSPAGRALLLILSAFVIVALGWSVFGRLDTVAVAGGQTLPSGRIKVIQPMEIATVRAIHVREGEAVAEGQLLIEFDPTVAGADAAQASRAAQSAKADMIRAEAVLAHLKRGRAAADAGVDLPADLAASALARARTRIAEYEARREALVKSRGEREAERAAAETAQAMYRETQPLVEQQLKTRRELAEKGYNSKLLVLELEAQRIERLRDAEVQAKNAERAAAAIAGIDAQLVQLKEELARQTLAEHAEAEDRARAAAEELKKAAMREGLQYMRSPVAGTVQQLQVHTLGGVVQPAEKLMAIVPHDADIVVEARVLNKDAGFVHEGQDVRVKLEAFPFTSYGLVAGRLEYLSRDAVADDKLGLVYMARIRLGQNHIDVAGRQVPLGAGMAVQAEIKTGERSIIKYLLSPILKTVDEAARER